MRFAPEYVTIVLNENFEDAKELLLTPLMAIHYAHLVMLTECGIVSREDARVLRGALDGISLETVREVSYDGTYEDLFFFIERLVKNTAGEDVAGRLHPAGQAGELAQGAEETVLCIGRAPQRDRAQLGVERRLQSRQRELALQPGRALRPQHGDEARLGQARHRRLGQHGHLHAAQLSVGAWVHGVGGHRACCG